MYYKMLVLKGEIFSVMSKIKNMWFAIESQEGKNVLNDKICKGYTTQSLGKK